MGITYRRDKLARIKCVSPSVFAGFIFYVASTVYMLTVWVCLQYALPKYVYTTLILLSLLCANNLGSLESSRDFFGDIISKITAKIMQLFSGYKTWHQWYQQSTHFHWIRGEREGREGGSLFRLSTNREGKINLMSALSKAFQYLSMTQIETIPVSRFPSQRFIFQVTP